LGQPKTRKLWDLSPRDLELYLYASTRPQIRSDREMARQLSEITSARYHRSQVVNTRNRLRRMRLMNDDFTLTQNGLNDLLDRLTRFAGRGAYDPAIREAKDLGDNQRYFRILLHGAEIALKGTRPARSKLNETGILRTNMQILHKLKSKEPVPQLTQEQREKITMLLETSTEFILHGLADEQRQNRRRRTASRAQRREIMPQTV
jgi:hypothetical protein